MLLLFNADRSLARLAADAPAAPTRVHEPWSAAPAAAGDLVPPADAVPIAGSVPPARRQRLAELLRRALVGGPADLRAVLTADAEGWSPTLRFRSRAEAEQALRDHTSSLRVGEFRVDRLCWSAPIVFGEWTLVARQQDPIIVGDDLLVEGCDRAVVLGGASVAELRGNRIATLRSYFDDAALIEQVLLRR